MELISCRPRDMRYLKSIIELCSALTKSPTSVDILGYLEVFLRIQDTQIYFQIENKNINYPQNPEAPKGAN